MALDVEDPVEVDVSPQTLFLLSESTKDGLVGGVCSSDPLLLSKTTTSDIEGLEAAED